jgi:hypothetical protein
MKTRKSVTKSLKIFVIVVLLSLFIIPETSFAQPPKWAPAHGYRAKTRHVYFPEHNFYYDIQARNYLYFNKGNWSVSVAIPTPFISINLGRSSQIQLDYYGAYPYYYNADHRVKYKKVKVYKQKKQVIYVRDNEHHDHGNKHEYKHENKHGNGNGHGNKHGNGRGNGNGHGKNH